MVQNENVCGRLSVKRKFDQTGGGPQCRLSVAPIILSPWSMFNLLASAECQDENSKPADSLMERRQAKASMLTAAVVSVTKTCEEADLQKQS